MIVTPSFWLSRTFGGGKGGGGGGAPNNNHQSVSDRDTKISICHTQKRINHFCFVDNFSECSRADYMAKGGFQPLVGGLSRDFFFESQLI